jgi:hypothetical protein
MVQSQGIAKICSPQDNGFRPITHSTCLEVLGRRGRASIRPSIPRSELDADTHGGQIKAPNNLLAMKARKP